MIIELTRFKVKAGKEDVVTKWMETLNNHMDEVLDTLDAEKMYVETIFREKINGEEYLYWYSIQGEGGINVDESSHEIDKLHVAFWEECIDPNYPPVQIVPQVLMIPDRIREKMK